MNKTLFRSENYYDLMDCPFLREDVMTGAEISAMRHRLANDDRYTEFDIVVSDSDLDFKVDYQITYIDEDITALTAWYIEVEVKKLSRY